MAAGPELQVIFFRNLHLKLQDGQPHHMRAGIEILSEAPWLQLDATTATVCRWSSGSRARHPSRSRWRRVAVSQSATPSVGQCGSVGSSRPSQLGRSVNGPPTGRLELRHSECPPALLVVPRPPTRRMPADSPGIHRTTSERHRYKHRVLPPDLAPDVAATSSGVHWQWKPFRLHMADEAFRAKSGEFLRRRRGKASNYAWSRRNFV
jgi:hypothetical protein